MDDSDDDDRPITVSQQPQPAPTAGQPAPASSPPQDRRSALIDRLRESGRRTKTVTNRKPLSEQLLDMTDVRRSLEDLGQTGVPMDELRRDVLLSIPAAEAAAEAMPNQVTEELTLLLGRLRHYGISDLLKFFDESFDTNPDRIEALGAAIAFLNTEVEAERVSPTPIVCHVDELKHHPDILISMPVGKAAAEAMPKQVTEELTLLLGRLRHYGISDLLKFFDESFDTNPNRIEALKSAIAFLNTELEAERASLDKQSSIVGEGPFHRHWSLDSSPGVNCFSEETWAEMRTLVTGAREAAADLRPQPAASQPPQQPAEGGSMELDADEAPPPAPAPPQPPPPQPPLPPQLPPTPPQMPPSQMPPPPPPSVVPLVPMPHEEDPSDALHTAALGAENEDRASVSRLMLEVARLTSRSAEDLVGLGMEELRSHRDEAQRQLLRGHLQPPPPLESFAAPSLVAFAPNSEAGRDYPTGWAERALQRIVAAGFSRTARVPPNALATAEHCSFVPAAVQRWRPRQP